MTFGILLSVVILTGTCTGRQGIEKSAFGTWGNLPVIKITGGLIQGKSDKEHTWCWLGIPYAAPPEGALRWRAPIPPASWEGVRKTTRFGNRCTQIVSLFTTRKTGSEDCLTLNIWRPRSEETGLPVYVWIHGGGNSIGDSAMEGYHGNALASRNNAVFVSINYRLGPLGWFSHPALRENRSGLDASGNYGLLDILAALTWIRYNIEAFGGDPENVTLTGESAGAANTIALIISPLSRGLFHKAIAQSGYQRSVSRAEADSQGEEVLISLIMKKNKLRDRHKAEALRKAMSDSEVARFFESCTDRELVDCYISGPTGMTEIRYFIEDGEVFPVGGYELLKSGWAGNPVPALLGSNRNETKMFLLFDRSMKAGTPLYETIAEIGSLRFKVFGVDQIADGLTLCGVPVWTYRFDYGTPDSAGKSPWPRKLGLKLGAFHTAEIPFFLGTDSVNGRIFTSMIFTPDNRKSRRILSGIIMAYTGSFIHSGDPNGPGMSGSSERPCLWPGWKGSSQDAASLVFNMNGEKPALITVWGRIDAGELPQILESRLSGEELQRASNFLKM